MTTMEIKLKEPKQYHIVFSKDMDMESLSAILNEMDLVINSEERAKELKDMKLKGVNIIYQ